MKSPITKGAPDERMEQKIMDVARELFLDRGFALTSTVEIARRVGCNQALVHYYFRSKELLFAKIFEAQVREFSIVFLRIDQEGGTFIERLRRVIGAHFDVLNRDRRLPFLVLSEVMTKPERLEIIREVGERLPENMVARMGKDLEQAVAEGVVRPMIFIDLMMSIVSLNVGSVLSLPVLEHVVGMGEEQREAFLSRRREEVVTTIINSLRP